MKEQEAKINVESKGQFNELEKPFGYLKTDEKNYITCFNVRIETKLTEEEVKEKIKNRDWIMITMLAESIITIIETQKN